MDPAGWFGPYGAVARLARGGMGEVWRARHPELGLDVAVKTVPSAARAVFDVEVANVATLAHPGIVRLFDRGYTGEAWGDVPAGTPWMAMELAQASLASRPPPTLRALRDALAQVLEALGHAHGRGILHLDVKPGNLLRDGDRVLLADFGISALGAGARAGGGWGTPGFAAPEQLEGRWRDLGPWTDVHALGATALALAGPALGGPLRAWVHRATQPLPGARFPSAAAAREALLELDPDGAALPTAAVEATAPVGGAEGAAPALWRPEVYWPRAVPPLPAPAPVRRQLAGAGASVFGQRSVPLVAREAERARLWEALAGALATRSPRWVWVTGPSGVGKSRLAEWLATEAHAATGCRVWRAGGADRDALRDAVADGLSTRGLGGRALEDHLRQRVGPVPALAAWLEGRPVPTAAVARALAEVLGAGGPALVWLDDAHDADPELLAALAAGLRGAVLVVATARDLARVAELPGERLPLGPLAPEAVRALLSGLLGLDPASAADLADRAEGNALVAAHLVAGAIAAGELRAGRDGLRVRAGELRLPRNATEVWERRLAEVAGADRAALELAAILGHRFGEAWRRGVPGPVDDLVGRALRAQLWWSDAGELRWTHELAREAVLTGLDARARADLHRRAAACVDAAAEPGRAGRHHVGAGDLAQGAALLLEAVRRHAAEGDWRAADRADRDLELALERLGGGPLALDRALERARMATSRRRAAEGRAILDAVRERVFAEGTVHQRGLYEFLSGEAFLLDQRAAEALACYERAEALHGDAPARRVRLLRAQARCLRLLDALPAALERLERARRLAAGLDDAVFVADLLLTLAVTRHVAGRLDEAREGYHEAIAAYGEAYPGPVSQAWNNLGALHRRRGERPEARAAYARARAFAETAGVATDDLDLGEALLDLDDAPEVARATLERLCERASGAAARAFAHLYALAVCEEAARWDHHLAAARALMPELPADPDLAEVLDLAARRAEAAGWPERAREARSAAASASPARA